MNREQRYGAYMGLLIGLLLGLILLLQGCSTVSLSRTDDNVTLNYRSFLTKIQAPTVEVTRDGEYSARFNAESVDRSIDLAPLRDIVRDAWPFILWMVLCLGIITFIPDTVLWLPRLLGYQG